MRAASVCNFRVTRWNRDLCLLDVHEGFDGVWEVWETIEGCRRFPSVEPNSMNNLSGARKVLGGVGVELAKLCVHVMLAKGLLC